MGLKKVNEGLVAVTLHNILQEHEKWFDQFIESVASTYGFIDPKIGLSKSMATSGLKVLLTFDDGFRSNRVVAEKILAKHGVRGVFFLTEKFIGLSSGDAFSFASKRFYPNSKLRIANISQFEPMSWDDVYWLIENDHVIGAHTTTHPNLSEINSEDQLTDEIIGSADRMEEKLRTKINNFSYPFGNISAINISSERLARKRFKFSFSNIRGNLEISPSRSFLYRQNIDPANDPTWLAKAIVEGKLNWIYGQARKKAKAEFSKLSWLK